MITRIALIKKKMPFVATKQRSVLSHWIYWVIVRALSYRGLITHFNRLYFSTQKEVYPLYGVLNSYLPITKLLITRHGVRIREGIVWFSNTHLLFIIKQKIATF